MRQAIGLVDILSETVGSDFRADLIAKLVNLGYRFTAGPPFESWHLVALPRPRLSIASTVHGDGQFKSQHQLGSSRIWRYLWATTALRNHTATRQLSNREVKPELIAQIRFAEWTAEGRLRHAAFVGMRMDKSADDVRRESRGPIMDILPLASRNPISGPAAFGGVRGQPVQYGYHTATTRLSCRRKLVLIEA